MAPGYSLNEYNKKQTPANGHIDNANIDKTRNHAATQNPMNGWKGGIFNYPPQADFSKKWTTDPLANFGSGGSKTDTLNTVLTAATGILTLGATAASIFASKNAGQSDSTAGNFSKKEVNNINKNSENAEAVQQALDSGIETANSIDDNSSQETIADTAGNLMDAITTAQNQKNDAVQKASTAEANIKTLKIDKTKEKTVYDGLLAEKATLSKSLSDLKNADTSKMSSEEKNAHEEKINKLEKDLKQLEKKIAESKKKLEEFDQKILVQEQIKTNNENTAKALDTKINEANKLVEKLNKRIKK